MASDNGFFSAKSISLSRYGGRKPQTLMDAARHNLREIQAEFGADSHIDASRIAENVLLAGPGTAEGVQAVAGEWLDGAGIDPSKLRRDHCQAIEVLFSLPEQSGLEPVAYFRSCLEWASAETRLPVLSAVIHMDEAAPHLHVLMLPVQGSIHVGNKSIAKTQLKVLADSFFNTVAGPAGLKRMGAKMVGPVKRMAVAAVLRTCEAQGMPEKVGVLWPILRAAIERDPTKAVQALNLSEGEIRGGGKGAPNPIGFEQRHPEATQKPIAFEKHPQKTRNLSCVGFAQQTTCPAPAERAASDAEASSGEVKEKGVGAGRKCIETFEELLAVVGCRSVWKSPKKPGRQTAAGGAMVKDVKAAKPARKAVPLAKVAPAAPAPAPATPAGPPPVAAVERKDGDGVVRVRDEFADDLSAWGDY